MATFMLSSLMLCVYVITSYCPKTVEGIPLIFSIIILMYTLNTADIRQILPGNITHNQQEYDSESNAILRNVSENESVYIVVCGGIGGAATIIKYRCSPIRIDWGSPGKERYEGDVYSKDYTKEEFVSLLGNYDYVYLLMIDDTFTDQYVDGIINPEILHEHVLYRIETVHGKIKLIET